MVIAWKQARAQLHQINIHCQGNPRFTTLSLGACSNYAVMTRVVSHQREILLGPEGNATWSGSNVPKLNSAAITWALAKRMCALVGRYWIVLIDVLIGFFPKVHWALDRVFPQWRKLSMNTASIVLETGTNYYENTP